MVNILQEPLDEYLANKGLPFAKNTLADKFRKEYPKLLASLIGNNTRYKVEGSPGKGQWTNCPWIAIFDLLITESAQSGFYPVFLFKGDMTGVYLSLNQGVTDVRENYKGGTSGMLKLRSIDYREKLELNSSGLLTEIDLNSSTDLAKLYESGNIFAKYYPKGNLPSEEVLQNDIFFFLKLYRQLIYRDDSFQRDDSFIGIEHKKMRMHSRVERATSLSKKVKAVKGYTCESCNFNFTEKYGELGKQFIEAHHLTPISEMGFGRISLNLENDFAVLCSNCHRMIHRMEDPSDVDGLKKIINNML